MQSWRQAVRAEPRWKRFLRGVVQRAQAGNEPHPWWMPRRLLSLVSADVDDAAGVAAIWILWRPKSSRVREHIALLEWFGEEWRCVGGSSSCGDDPDDVDVLEVGNGGGVLSLTRSLDPPHSIAAALWISWVKVRVGRDVSHVLIGVRRIEVPRQRGVISVWASPQTRRGVRPVIVALGRDGGELSRVGPQDRLDTHTWSRLREEL